MRHTKVRILGALKNLAVCRNQVGLFLDKENLESHVKEAMVMAIDEAVANVIEHSYVDSDDDQYIEIDLSSESGKVVIRILDEGEYFNPLQNIPTENQNAELLDDLLADNVESGKDSGLGVAIYLRVMDEVSHNYKKSSGNELVFVKYTD